MSALPRPAEKLRVGLFGGSFNPAHAGHTHVAACARRALRLDCVLWAVSPQNPLKPKYEYDLAARVASAKRAARNGRDRVSAFEARIGSTCTIESVTYLRKRYPGVRWVWIMGADNLATFHLWQRADAIAASMPMAVIGRPSYVAAALRAPFAQRYARYRIDRHDASLLANMPPPAWVFLNLKRDPRSSTAVRAGLMSDGL